MAESEELKSLLKKVKDENEKVGIKLIHKTKIMASGSIALWQIDMETMETVTDLIFLGSQITVNGDRSHEKTFVSRKESYDKPSQYIKKQRHPYSQNYSLSSSHIWT